MTGTFILHLVMMHKSRQLMPTFGHLLRSRKLKCQPSFKGIWTTSVRFYVLAADSRIEWQAGNQTFLNLSHVCGLQQPEQSTIVSGFCTCILCFAKVKKLFYSCIDRCLIINEWLCLISERWEWPPVGQSRELWDSAWLANSRGLQGQLDCSLMSLSWSRCPVSSGHGTYVCVCTVSDMTPYLHDTVNAGWHMQEPGMPTHTHFCRSLHLLSSGTHTAHKHPSVFLHFSSPCYSQMFDVRNLTP